MILAATLVFELVRESLTGAHYRYRQYENGLPTDTYITTKTELNVSRAPSRAENIRVVDGRVIHRRIVTDEPYKPWQEDRDAVTGALIRRTPLFFNAKPARVFDPNPVASLNAPELQDANDANVVPEGAYKSAELPDTALNGPWAALVDTRVPSITPPEGDLVFTRAENGFEDVNAYFHIHRNQEWVQSLGYRGARAVAPYAVPVDAHAVAGEDNSFFVPSGTQTGRGALFYGEGGTDDAEDADLVVHEYAHALMEWIAPGTFGGGFGSESRALGEGTADYWAFSAHVDVRRASGRDPYCFADWDARCWLDASSERCAYPAGSDCLRRLDSARTMADYEPGEQSGIEHRNGAIWSSALRELREQIPRNELDTIVLESIYGAPPRPTFAVMARRLIETDRELYQGAHIGLICTAMGKRGILTECEVPMRGELTHFQSTQHGAAISEIQTGLTTTITIDDARIIEKVFVRVDIAHSARGDLYIELIAPDGTVILLQPSSSSRTPDIHVTYGLTAVPAESLDLLRGRSAAGTWLLRVTDRAPQDHGTLLSWGLDIQFAGDEPQASRPRAAGAMTIPVVAHLYGQSGAYVSDVRLFNHTNAAQTLTLIFTRSTKNGLEEFLATRVFIAARQLILLDDVVDHTFHTAGSGSLQVLGDVTAASRLYVRTANGTLGQDVPAHNASTSRTETPLVVAPFTEAGARYNLGITEIRGARGTIRAGDRELVIEPYAHVQFPVSGSPQEIRVLDGEASVVAYLSQIRDDDAMYLAATRSVDGIAPAITSQVSGDPEWRSDLRAHTAVPTASVVRIAGDGERPVDVPLYLTDVLAVLFHRTVTVAAMSFSVNAPDAAFAVTRVVHGATTQAVPFIPPRGGTQHILFAANDAEYRTNIGVVTPTGATIEVRTYVGNGALTDDRSVDVAPGLYQFPLVHPVSNGRVEVQFRTGSGVAYGSFIDRRTGDATYFPGQ